MNKINNNAVKMQKLRHAVERIRNLRSIERRSETEKILAFSADDTTEIYNHPGIQKNNGDS